MSSATVATDWDLTVVWPSLESPEFAAAYQQTKDRAEALTAEFDRLGIQADSPAKADDTSTLVSVIDLWNAFDTEYQTLEAYVYGHYAVDTKDEAAQASLSGLDAVRAVRAKLSSRLEGWAGTRAPGDHPTLQAHRYWIEKAKTAARHQMTGAEESLAADLAASAVTAWERLHADATAQLKVAYRGGTLTMNEARNLAFDDDPAVRKDAYTAELAAWPGAELASAAAMNAIKGATGTLEARRGWTPFDVAVFRSNIDHPTLEAMLSAARDAFPVLRRYMRAKARLVRGQERLPFYDLFAQVGESTTTWDYDRAVDFVADQFRTFSPRMADMALRARAERWIDATPKPNKVGGAFCMHLRGGESRLLQTWKPTLGSVGTLAHELGHAYHNLCLAERTPLQRETPMTLAETASIFCEVLVHNASIAEASGTERLAILERSLQRSTQVVVDIVSRFDFETAVYARRQERALSPAELCQAMLDAQEGTYGDGLSDERHPYMWAAKPHYYSAEAFYNFPYMFGHLFSLGLYAVYEQDKEGFVARYDQLLSSTGLASAGDLAAGFGIDIKTKAFWEGSLAMVAAEVAEFEQQAQP
ncbi:MAG: M3 family oligoendopeptidase [Fimbriimonadaceae bacterium]|nr:M3 family oligoendopeptidase [Fimbriimonadaceae bacterium]